MGFPSAGREAHRKAFVDWLVVGAVMLRCISQTVRSSGSNFDVWQVGLCVSLIHFCSVRVMRLPRESPKPIRR